MEDASSPLTRLLGVGADERRVLRDIPTREGFDRDEYPPAVGRVGGTLHAMSERAPPVVVQSGGEERRAEALARRPGKARWVRYGPIQPSRRRLGGWRLRRVLLATSEVP
jgi:hypothetical protein